jgi:hypothetical protein
MKNITSEWLAEDLCWQFHNFTLRAVSLDLDPSPNGWGRHTEGAARVGVEDARDDTGVSKGPRGSALRCSLTIAV